MNNQNSAVNFLLALKELPPNKLFALGFSGALFILFSLVLLQWHLRRCENFWQLISYPKLKGKEWILLILNAFILTYIVLILTAIFQESMNYYY